jgi:hypothetical protein
MSLWKNGRLLGHETKECDGERSVCAQELEMKISLNLERHLRKVERISEDGATDAQSDG